MSVEIDKYSGFCFGVTNAINTTEKVLKDNDLYCLGHIVHNKAEEKRLNKLGLKTVDYEEFAKLQNKNVLIRAHGEPPKTYKTADENKLNLIDATCPVVIKLQKKIKDTYNQFPGSLIVIYGKKGHAEVNGLVGQTNDRAVVISNIKEAGNIDINKQIFIFSQTTANHRDYNEIINFLKNKAKNQKGDSDNIISFNTICPTVINRVPKLEKFVKSHDIIVFVSDPESSNGKMLFDFCLKHNKNSYFVSNIEDLKDINFKKELTVGISGATSTPFWLMESIKKNIEKILKTMK